MTMNNPIGWVEIPVTDLDRAETFYNDWLGFSFDRQDERGGFTMSWFPMDMESYGSAGTLIKGNSCNPSHNGTLVYFSAPETVEKSLEKAQSLGAEILVPKTNMGEHGFYGCVEDSEGNKVAVHSMVG